MDVWRLVAAVSAISSLAACSPYVFSDEVAQFNAGVTAVSDAYVQGVEDIQNNIDKDTNNFDIKNKSRLVLSKECSEIDRPGDCVLRAAQGEALPAAFENLSVLQSDNAKRVFGALKDYASSLAAITKADDSKQLESAITDLITSAGNFRTAVSSLAGQPAPDNTPLSTVASLFGSIATGYLDQRRLAALRIHVAKADPAVALLGDKAAKILTTMRLHQLAIMSHDLRIAAQPFESNDEKTRGKIDYVQDLPGLQEQVASFNAAKRSDPAEVVKAMVDSHHKLAQALREDKGETAAVLDATEDFLNRAAAMRNALSKPGAKSGV